MIKATIDTNVIISGLVFGGVPSKVLQLALERRFEMVLSPPLIVEVERVLFSKKFGLTTQEGRELLQPIVDISTFIVVFTQKSDDPMCYDYQITEKEAPYFRETYGCRFRFNKREYFLCTRKC